jgi:energy-coupling factor transporter ATP-binding protein EcfA2
MIVEHDMDVVFALSDRISVLVYGQVIATGTPEEIRGQPRGAGSLPWRRGGGMSDDRDDLRNPAARCCR